MIIIATIGKFIVKIRINFVMKYGETIFEAQQNFIT